MPKSSVSKSWFLPSHCFPIPPKLLFFKCPGLETIHILQVWPCFDVLWSSPVGESLKEPATGSSTWIFFIILSFNTLCGVILWLLPDMSQLFPTCFQFTFPEFKHFFVSCTFFSVPRSLSLSKTCEWVLPCFCWNTYAVISLRPHGIYKPDTPNK